MTLRSLFPAGPDIEPGALLAELGAAGPAAPATTGRNGGSAPLRVGDDRIIDFLHRFARALLAPAVARSHPELASLGFFLRKGELAAALSTLDSSPAGSSRNGSPEGGSQPRSSTLDEHGDGIGRDAVLRFPRGLVFHVPPANVDTVFAYSWALSALAGNRNVVRVSERSGAAAEAVLAALHVALSAVDADTAAAITASQRMIGYGRDDAATAALSAASDLRVLWGGDAAVRAVRAHPLHPAARDLTFPDRASFAVLAVDGWQRADAARRRAAAEGFYADAYWFDQAACSSPRTVFWVGDPAAARRAAAEFGELLRAVVAERRPVVDAAMAVQQRVSGYGLAATGAATAVRFDGNALATLELRAGAGPSRDWLGTGMFPWATLPRLDDLARVIERRDQTLSVFGFGRDELLALARTLNGRGIDRIVPFGSALRFAAVWDGYDLLREFTRLTTVTLDPDGPTR